MSEMEMSYGYMASLKTPISSEEYEKKTEEMYEKSSKIHYNYEGTMIYYDFGGKDTYGIIFAKSNLLDEFLEDVKKEGIEINDDARFYVCNWYNGADSDMSMMELKDFSRSS